MLCGASAPIPPGLTPALSAHSAFLKGTPTAGLWQMRALSRVLGSKRGHPAESPGEITPSSRLTTPNSGNGAWESALSKQSAGEGPGWLSR